MRFVIITGLSGAGRSTSIKFMEDLGFFCIDNLPPQLIPKFAEICSHSEGKIDKVAIGIDARAGYLLKDFFSYLNCLGDMGYNYEMLFLEASDDVLIKRFKQNRRSHPLSREGRIIRGITEERTMLKEVRTRANYTIDTTNLSTNQLREQLKSIFVEGKKFEGLIVSMMSFGFKYGIPVDADLIFDVRFIPNPYYIESLKKLTGLNEKVSEYVFEKAETQVFIEKTVDLLEFLIPNYIKEGKTQLVIGIGCTGGRHRSVAIAKKIGDILSNKSHKITVEHRDIEKDGRRA